MNIGLFTDCYLPTKNGVATAVFQAKRELELRGHRVVAVTVSEPSCVEQDRSVCRFPSLPFNRTIEIRLGLAPHAAVNRLVEREKLDVIHTHTEFSLGWAGKQAAQRNGLPLVHTAHTLYEEYRHYLPLGNRLPRPTVRWVLAHFLAGYDAVICPSVKMRTYVASYAPSIRTIVIRNGVNRDRFAHRPLAEADKEQVRATLGLRQSDRIMLYVGRISPEKRILELFAAVKPLLGAHPDYRLLVVGSGPLEQSLARAVQEAGLTRQVVLAGLVEWERTEPHRLGMVELYAVAHAFVTASLSEVHPMTVIEAAMCGLPVVARRDDGLADLIEDGFSGFLVDRDDQISEKLREVLSDEATRCDMARHIRSLSDRFSIEAHVDQLEALYGQVAARAPAGAAGRGG